jgi:hypothetical protein
MHSATVRFDQVRHIFPLIPSPFLHKNVPSRKKGASSTGVINAHLVYLFISSLMGKNQMGC